LMDPSIENFPFSCMISFRTCHVRHSNNRTRAPIFVPNESRMCSRLAGLMSPNCCSSGRCQNCLIPSLRAAAWLHRIRACSINSFSRPHTSQVPSVTVPAYLVCREANPFFITFHPKIRILCGSGRFQ
jgi:hypothetical protein